MSSYKPRNPHRSRVPLMRRLRDAMNVLIDKGNSAGASSVKVGELNALFDIIYILQEEDGKKKLEPHQKDLVDFAVKFAQFMAKLSGAPFRMLITSKKDASAPGSEQTRVITVNPPIPRFNTMFKPVANRTVPSILRRKMPREEPVKEEPPSPGSVEYEDDEYFDEEEEEDVKNVELIKEEALCDVDATPLVLDELGNPIEKRTGVIEGEVTDEVKKEIKEEEPDCDQPGTSGNDDSYDLNWNEAPAHHTRKSAPGSTGLLGARMQAARPTPHQYAYSLAGPKRAKRTMEPHDNDDGTPHLDDSRFEEFMKARKRTAEASKPMVATVNGKRIVAGVPGISRPISDPTKKITVNRFPLLKEPVMAKPVTIRSAVQESLAALDPAEDPRYKQCDFCELTIAERDYARHFNQMHAFDHQQSLRLVPADGRSRAVPCHELACDFECDTKKEMEEHVEKIHNQVYRNWISKKRFNLKDGTFCPYCDYLMRGLAQLCKHLSQFHAERAQEPNKIFTCYSCKESFCKLHEVYSHWHQSICSGVVIVENDKSLKNHLPKSLIETGSQMITGPKGQTGFNNLHKVDDTNNRRSGQRNTRLFSSFITSNGPEE